MSRSRIHTRRAMRAVGGLVGRAIAVLVVLAAGAIRAEEGNLVANGGMEEVNETEKLPRQWETATFPGLETVYEIKLTEDRHGDKQAVELSWKRGSPQFGISPSLSGPVRPGCAYALSAWVKTDATGVAVLGVSGSDVNGRMVMPLTTSKPLENAPTWSPCVLQFDADKDVASLKIYCLNTGKGKVWFDDVQLHPATAAAAAPVRAALPFKASCEPVSGNGFWQNQKQIFNTFVDSPCTLSLVLYGKREEFKNPRVIIETPSEVDIAEIDFVTHTSSGSIHAERLMPAVSQAPRGTATYSAHAVGLPDQWDLTGQPSLVAPAESFPRITVHFEPRVARTESEYPVYWRLENASQRSDERTFAVKFLPPLRKPDRPPVFKGGLFCFHDVNVADAALLDRILQKYERVGIQQQYNLANSTAAVNRRLTERGWEMGGAVFTLPENLPSDWMPPDLRGQVRWAVGPDGVSQSGPNATPCPTFAAQSAEFRKFFKKFTQEAIRETPNGATICVDHEPFGVPAKKCFCASCLAEFCRKHDLAREKISSPKQLLRDYGNQWGAFWCALMAGMLAEVKEAVRETHPDSKVIIYDYVADYAAPDIGNTLFACPLDVRLIDGVLDGHMFSIAGSYKNDLLKNLDLMRNTVRAPFVVNPRISRFTGVTADYTSRDDALSPTTLRLQLIASAASGAKEYNIYPGVFIDGMFFREIQRAQEELAAVEDFYFKGEACHHAATVAIANQNDIRPAQVGVRCNKFRENLLVTLFNYHESQNAFLSLRVPAGAKGMAVWDPVRRTIRKSPAGKMLWSAKEIAAGIPAAVPAQEARFLVLSAKKDVPAGLTEEKVDLPSPSGPNKAASFQAVTAGDRRIVAGEDLNQDGEPEVIMEDRRQSVWISPTEGGRILRWLDKADQTLVCDRAGRTGLAADMLWDLRWLPTEMRSTGATKPPRYAVKQATLGNDGVTLALAGKDETGRLSLQKTCRLSEGGGLRVSYSVRLADGADGDEPYAFWSHNCPTLGLDTNVDRRSSVVARGPAGVVVIRDDGSELATETVYAVKGAGATGVGDQPIHGELTAGTFAFYAPEKGKALRVEVEFDKLAQLYSYGSSKLRTLEWMYRPVRLKPGVAWTTSIKFQILDKKKQPEQTVD